MSYLAVLSVPGAFWLLGSLLYLSLSWRDMLADLRTPGLRRLIWTDLLIALAWPLLLIVDLLMVPIQRFRRARAASRR